MVPPRKKTEPHLAAGESRRKEVILTIKSNDQKLAGTVRGCQISVLPSQGERSSEYPRSQVGTHSPLGQSQVPVPTLPTLYFL